MVEFNEELVLRLYKTMYTIRAFEEKVSEYAGMGMIPGFMIHLYVGQEAVATGVCAALREDDYIVSTHRGHGHLIAKGASIDRMMAELRGKETGYCRGRGGSMHIASVEVGGLGANGIVGAGLVIAPGAALSARLRGTDQVAVCFFGDGASNQGTFHEGLNLAATWKLPVVFVCENNGYGFSTPQSVHQSVKRVSQRAAAYDIPGMTVDGDDVLEVYLAASWAVERARDGGGPTLLEAATHRWHGHFEDDEDDDPVLFFEHKALYFASEEVPVDPQFTVPLGQAAVLREGEDVTIFAVSGMVSSSMSAANSLAREGIGAEIIDPRTLVPLDKETLLASVRKTGRLVTVEEGCITGGVGAEITALVTSEAWDALKGPVIRVAAKDQPVPFSPVLEAACAPNTQNIAVAARVCVGARERSS